MTQAAHLKAETTPAPFHDAAGHLAAELRRLDLLIARRVALFRHSMTQMENRVAAAPTYVSDQELDWLLQRAHSYNGPDRLTAYLDRALKEQEAAIAAGIAACEQAGGYPPVLRLASLFDLSPLEYQTLIICLAPELRRKYDRIYAYLQDDITRKRTSLDLVLDLLIDNETDRWQARALLGEGSNLFFHRLVHAVKDMQSPSGSSGLSRLLQLDQRILHYILGDRRLDPRLGAFAAVVTEEQSLAGLQGPPPSFIKDMIQNALHGRDQTKSVLLHFHGVEGAGRHAPAMEARRCLGRAVLKVDGRVLFNMPNGVDEWLPMLGRESRLLEAVLLMENMDAWLPGGADPNGRLTALCATLNRYCPLAFTSACKPWPVAQTLSPVVFNIATPLPDAHQQDQLWRKALSGMQFDAGEVQVSRLIQQFQLSAQQIEIVSNQLRLKTADASGKLSLADLAEACRDVSHHGLSEMSVHIRTHYQWDDLVLPAELKEQLRNICAQVRFRKQVFEDWGFAQKMPYGRGLSAMFSGTPGTGKTMAAQVIARDLKLDLFKIDLSGVVSKYIGETEKNLNRVFAEARSSNAVLFFDEADALFGKRTEVSDAHDRYANIEVSYLLQKMEEYDGIVVLATNFRNNMDEAFVRRIRFILEFPFPDSDSRREIFQRCIPAQTPTADDIDFQWLGRHVKVAGGNIKNIVLNAAFAAARQHAVLGMAHMVESCKLEFQKIGKIWDAGSMNYLRKSAGDR